MWRPLRLVSPRALSGRTSRGQSAAENLLLMPDFPAHRAFFCTVRAVSHIPPHSLPFSPDPPPSCPDASRSRASEGDAAAAHASSRSLAADLAALRRLPDIGSAPEFLARAESSGLMSGSEHVRLWCDGSGAVHVDMCLPGMQLREVSLREAAEASAAADGKRSSWCECGGVVAAPPVRRLWRLARLWQIVDGALPVPRSWFHLAALVEALRPHLSGQDPWSMLAPSSVWGSSLEAVEGLSAAASEALSGTVMSIAAGLDRADLLRIFCVPAAKVRVSFDEGESLSAWGRRCSLSRALDIVEASSRELRDFSFRYAHFDAEVVGQLALSGPPVLVDLGPSVDPDGGCCADAKHVVMHAPVPVVMAYAAGLVEVAGGRLWGHMPRLAAEGLSTSLRLPLGGVASSDCRVEGTLVALGRLSSVLVEPASLDERMELLPLLLLS